MALKPIAATLIASVPLLLGGLWMLAAGMWNEAHRGEVAGAGLVVVLVVGLGMWVLGVVAVAFRIRRARGAAGT